MGVFSPSAGGLITVRAAGLRSCFYEVPRPSGVKELGAAPAEAAPLLAALAESPYGL